MSRCHRCVTISGTNISVVHVLVLLTGDNLQHYISAQRMRLKRRQGRRLMVMFHQHLQINRDFPEGSERICLEAITLVNGAVGMTTKALETSLGKHVDFFIRGIT